MCHSFLERFKKKSESHKLELMEYYFTRSDLMLSLKILLRNYFTKLILTINYVLKI